MNAINHASKYNNIGIIKIPIKYHQEVKKLLNIKDTKADTIIISYCCIVCIASWFIIVSFSSTYSLTNNKPKIFIHPNLPNGTYLLRMIFILPLDYIITISELPEEDEHQYNECYRRHSVESLQALCPRLVALIAEVIHQPIAQCHRWVDAEQQEDDCYDCCFHSYSSE